MPAYYNEIDPYAAQWLRNLIQAGLIADGEVDTRSIVDVRPDDLTGFEQCHFFAGLGGWSGALRLAGIADNEPLWTGSCPCQPFSLAGKQKGFEDERHLWPVWRELIRERRPARVLGEQVASAAQWLRLVRGDLEAMGYAVGTIPIEAASSGADHLRDRYWFVANGESERGRSGFCESATLEHRHGASGNGCMEHTERIERGRSSGASWPGAREHRNNSEVSLADPDGAAIRIEPRWSSGSSWSGPGQHCDDREGGDLADREIIPSARQRLDHADAQWGDGSGELSWVIGADGKARRVKSGIRLLAHGVPARVAKLRALGNAIDLRPAAAFIKAAI